MLFYAFNYLKFKLSSQKGQGMVEYALLIAFAAAIAVLVFDGTAKNGLGGALNDTINGVVDTLKGTKNTASNS